jgi:hypothetical protein
MMVSVVSLVWKYYWFFMFYVCSNASLSVDAMANSKSVAHIVMKVLAYEQGEDITQHCTIIHTYTIFMFPKVHRWQISNATTVRHLFMNQHILM